MIEFIEVTIGLIGLNLTPIKIYPKCHMLKFITASIINGVINCRYYFSSV